MEVAIRRMLAHLNTFSLRASKDFRTIAMPAEIELSGLRCSASCVMNHSAPPMHLHKPKHTVMSTLSCRSCLAAET